jgi:hypothetical protein
VIGTSRIEGVLDRDSKTKVFALDRTHEDVTHFQRRLFLIRVARSGGR